jgi:regulator of sigma E protease
MGVIGTVVAFLAILVVLVLVHELGHFIVAKRAGITVQEFGIGFPPRLASVMWRGTRYSLNAIPLGGFVKMLGEDGDIELQRLRQEGMTEVEIGHAMAGAFNRKPIWVRLTVLLAGVVMNFLFAAALFSVAVSLPQQVALGPLTVSEIQEGSPAAAALELDDVILAADGRRFERSRDLTEYVAGQAGEPVTLTVRRGGKEVEVTVVPRRLTEEQRAEGQGAIGFGWEPARIVEEPSLVQGPVEAVAEGLRAAGLIAIQIPGGLADAVGGMLGLNPDAADDARGPIGIAQETGRVLESPLVSQITFLGLLSVNLAVLNVLPFPPLDGGRMAVVVLEVLRRRRLPMEREALIYLTGLAILLTLVVLISIQDIQRLGE